MSTNESSSVLAKEIWRLRCLGLRTGAVADILDGLIWTTSDNGSGIIDELKTWLISDDPALIGEALSLKNVFLWDTRESLLADIARIKDSFPDLQSLLTQRLEAWDASHPESRG